MSPIAPIDRRAFLASVAAVGGSLALGFDIPLGPRPLHAGTAAPEITAWIVIEPDDTVIVRVARSEMGQGSFTALPMLVAEELECDWSKVKAEFVPPEENLRRNRAWGDMSTGGSRSIRASHDYLRKAGATAREMLIGAAAGEWNVPASECRAHNSVITHVPTGRTVTFGRIAAAAARVPAPKEIRLKDPKDWRLAGTPRKRLEIIDKVQGKPIYAIDVRVPNMLHAAVIQSPVFGGKLKAVDERRIAGGKGVRKVVKLDDAVAVVADHWWQAKKAVEALDLIWDDGGNAQVTSRSIEEFLRSGLAAKDAGVGRKEGDVAAGLAQAATRVEAEYAVPFLGHATLEPQNCTAHVTARQGRDLGAHAERRGDACGRRPGGRRAGAQRRRAQVHARRRVRPARRDAGLRVAGGQDRPAGRAAGEGHMDARGGHAPRLLPPGGHGQDDGRARRNGPAARLARADDRPIDHGE